MVKGFDRFRDHFAGADAQYVLIGGAACEVLLEEAGLEARLTKDLDIALVVEALDEAFIQRIASFVEAGGYEARERASGRREFYRYHRPKDEAYPKMLELFSRKPDGVELTLDAAYTPIPEATEIMSLSAILLDDDYYNLLLAHRRAIAGVSVLGEVGLIAFKARAYLDLCERRDRKEKVNPFDIRKHGADVLRLVQLFGERSTVTLPVSIASDMTRFAAALEQDKTFVAPPGLATAQSLNRLRTTFGLVT